MCQVVLHAAFTPPLFSPRAFRMAALRCTRFLTLVLFIFCCSGGMRRTGASAATPAPKPGVPVAGRDAWMLPHCY